MWVHPFDGLSLPRSNPDRARPVPVSVPARTGGVWTGVRQLCYSRRGKTPGAPVAPAQPELGDRLKVMFGEMSAGPMPPRLLELADRLEEAFQRGELFSSCGRRRAS